MKGCNSAREITSDSCKAMIAQGRDCVRTMHPQLFETVVSWGPGEGRFTRSMPLTMQRAECLISSMVVSLHRY